VTAEAQSWMINFWRKPNTDNNEKNDGIAPITTPIPKPIDYIFRNRDNQNEQLHDSQEKTHLTFFWCQKKPEDEQTAQEQNNSPKNIKLQRQPDIDEPTR